MELICIIGLLSYFAISNADDGPLVSTPLGTVQGYLKKSYYNRTYAAFEGIPYAQPPIGELRFSEPKPALSWVGILSANKIYSCIFFVPLPIVPNGIEDCLYMNIYVPREKIDANENLDVVVHIHAGAYMFGSPSMLAGPDYIMDKDVIFVSFSYRLSILGFLSTEDDVVPGNNGLKDQSLALRWIKDNIKYFGGNPDSVTLTGLSSGGSCVHLHYISPLSKGLFHRGLAQSGTALLPISLTQNPLEKAKQVADSLNCPTNSTDLMVKCLRNIDAKQLLNAIQVLFVYKKVIPLTVFGPVVERGDNPFLPDHPYRMMKNGHVYDVPLITSNTKDESLLFVSLAVFAHWAEELAGRFDELLPYLLDFNSTIKESDRLDTVKAIRNFYLQDRPLSYENVNDVVKMISDRYFYISSEKSIRLQAKATKAPVYYYFFEYITQQGFLFAVGANLKKGSAHTDDTRLMIKILGSPPILGEKDEKMMNLFTEFLANFAKTGKPIFNDVELKPVDAENEDIDYLNIISADDVKMKKMKHIGSYEFWETLPIMENEKLF